MAVKGAREEGGVKAMVGGLEVTRVAVESREVAAMVTVESATTRGVAVRVAAKAGAWLAEVEQGGVEAVEAAAAAAVEAASASEAPESIPTGYDKTLNISSTSTRGLTPAPQLTHASFVSHVCWYGRDGGEGREGTGAGTRPAASLPTRLDPPQTFGDGGSDRRALVPPCGLGRCC